MSKIAGKLSKCMSLLMAAVLCVQYLPVAVTAEAARPRSIVEQFGDGSDGALHIAAGQTVTLPVSIPYVSVVEKNYTSILIEAGGVLKCAAPNAGLVLRVQGDCTIKGVIDQNAKAPLTNTSNHFDYPPELQCGDGGNGGDGYSGNRPASKGGTGQANRQYGGGYSGGGVGGAGAYTVGGAGGSVDNLTTAVPISDLFKGSQPPNTNVSSSAGLWGGGSAGTSNGGPPTTSGGAGGTGAGADGISSSYAGGSGSTGYSGGGGAGNIGGGVVIIYADTVSLANTYSPSIVCNGGNGGNGGKGYAYKESGEDWIYGGGGGGGGGAGGGAVYIMYKSSISNKSDIEVKGGTGGSNGLCYPRTDHTICNSKPGESGTDGNITIKRVPDYTPPTITKVNVPTAWGTANTLTIDATDASGVIAYAVTSGNSVSDSHWQSSNRFTLTANGTYYAWAKDGVGNITAGTAFAVNRVDTANPVIDNVTVTPTGWTGSSTKAITVTATDGQSGIAGYGITTTTAAPSGWQTSNVFNKPTGTYYLWAKDNAGRVSGYRQTVVDSIDTDKPVISGVTVPTVWGQSSTVAINATDSGSGVNIYAVSASSSVPMDGWQSERSFTFTQNGTYYAFCKDKAGNICNSFRFVVDKVDTANPIITAAEVLPSGWTGSSMKTITVTASDSQSGIAGYGITTTEAVPSGWQTSNVFKKANGTYYVWTKDGTGRISASYRVTVEGVDTDKPVISGVTVPTVWGQSSTVAINATDSGSGIAGYAISESTVVPEVGWKISNSFTLTGNGTYYAFCKDNAGNVTAGKYFTVTKVDTVAPTISSISVKDQWSPSVRVTIYTNDLQSGIAGYAVSKDATAPVDGWQVSKDFDITVNGTYNAFVRDEAGNVSQGKVFTVDKADGVLPVISGITVSDEWAADIKIQVVASDVGGGIKEYAISDIDTEPSDGWQSASSFTVTANGTYYAWVRDKAGNLSVPSSFVVGKVDTIKPEVSGVKIPTNWGSTNMITVQADDMGSGIKDYAVSSYSFVPSTGWQSTADFALANNGKYYAFARDHAGNVSAGKLFEVSKVDTAAPVFDNVTVTPVGWTSSGTKTITVTASDGQSGVSGYSITTINTAPTAGWQAGSTFSKAAGTYYVWARDKVGNVSLSKQVVVDGIDTTAPVVTSAAVTPPGWTNSGTKTITVTATDSGGSGIAEYNITASNTAPTAGWQAGSTFSKAAGTYYVWARDKVGNVSVAFRIEVGQTDTVAPTVTGAEVAPTGWSESGTKTITVTAEDSQSGILGYGITTLAVQPNNWQDDNRFDKPVGTYYVWAKDNAGNVSASRRVVVENMDDVNPIISGVTLPGNWGQSNTATINATDMGNGIKDYAVSRESTLPVDGWKSERSFTLRNNGSYYAWARDKAGNTSDAFSFEVEWVDTAAPTVTGTEVTPPGWAENGTKTITVTAEDSQSGILGYGITTLAVQPNNWQDDNRFDKPLGTYYVWAKDNAGNVSASHRVVVENVDDLKPVISGVTLPGNWGQSNTATINATDVGNGLKDYAVSLENTLPVDGWQNERSFALTENGIYYAWARDKAGNTSDAFSFEVKWVDTAAPTVTGAEVTPPGWAENGTKTITVTAEDSQSGIAGYAVTTTTITPSLGGTWQKETTFTKPLGTYYVWAKDNAGNVSASHRVVVENMDDVKPVIAGVTLPDNWGQTNTATINASDVGNGLKDYAVSRENTLPVDGWQSERSFTLTENGSYYAWARDKADNVSDAFSFDVKRVDTTAPAVTGAEVTPSGWTNSGTKTITVTASDGQSGVSGYSITTINTAPTAGWQAGSTFSKAAGTYYVWARDKVGNVSVAFRIEVGQTDTVAPTVTGAEVTPPGWAENGTKTITVTAEDSQSGILGYGITTLAVQPNNWQDDNRFDKPLGTYYVWAKDNAGNVSASHRVVVENTDDVKPVISGVTLPDKWGQSNTATINASDVGGGLNIYAVSSTSILPGDGWQSSNSFTLSANGTYYAWCKDKVGNVSNSFSFEVDMIDTEAPVITETAVTPPGWVESGIKTITVTATDSQSGIAEYGITTTAAAPTYGWQAANTFSKPLSSYYLWAKDNAGNVSASHRVVVENMDDLKPVIAGVTLPDNWGQTNTATINASDLGNGLKDYAVSRENTLPVDGWQSERSFTLTENGRYYAWARDKADNISDMFSFEVEWVDTTAPAVIGAEVTPPGWTNSGTKTITVTASDGQSGVSGYSITTVNTAPTTGWQAGDTFNKAAGTYYVWARDKVGNVSVAFGIEVGLTDTVAPTVTGAEVSPTGWAESGTKTITVTAEDSQSGILGYGITTLAAQPNNWQDDNRFDKPLGTYYVWAKDNVGNVSASHRVVVENTDDAKPVIVGVTLPNEWGKTNTATINASDVGNGLKDYAVSRENTLPVDGWRNSAAFTLTENGSYYAWTRDKADNISDMFSFEVEWVDTAAPTVIGAEVSPTGWAENGTKTITVSAEDSQSGIAGYAVTTTTIMPSLGGTWQKETTFTKPLGTYYLWAKDNAGNVSASHRVVVENMDDVKPVIAGVTLPDNWGQTNTATINASDMGNGIKDYAVSRENTLPVDGWQSERSFTLTENGSYYAWARDKADNVSDAFSFDVKRVDTAAPTVTGAEVTPTGWTSSGTKTITVTAQDTQSGLTNYGVTETAVPPSSWQTGNSFSKSAGSYYVWAKDKSGRVSEPMRAVVDGIDTQKPTVKGVVVTPGWGNSARVLIEASDADSGIKDYAVSEYRYAPGTGWQPADDFTLAANGTYYAFARDGVGNISDGFSFTLDRVDTAKPVVDRVIIAPGFSSCVAVELEASDIGSGIKDYAVADSTTAPTDGWQSEHSFTLTENGSYYAFARDMVNNISVGRFFKINKMDRLPPTISSIGYSADNGTIMIRGSDSESSVVAIYIDGVAYPGSTVSWDVPVGTRYIRLQAEDEAGNRSAEDIHRVRGWYDLLDSITIEPVEFKDDNRRAIVIGKTTGENEISGVYVNGKFQDGNPVTYMVSAGTEYLELQAQDTAGDRSKLYRVRVPGWSQETAALSIVDVRFAQDNSTAQVTAMSTGGVEVRGIRVNGEMQVGNPVTYEIPIGTTHLKMQAEDMNGDRSATLIRRVPGWSEVVTTLTVTDVTFTDYNTTAQITATATGGDSVSGIIVNEKAYEGNPIVYTVPKDTETLHIQAYNPQGDKSPMVNKAVPMDSSKSTLKLSIEHPEWTKGRSARVKLVAEDKNRVTKILVRTGEDSEWADVTEKRYIDITADTTVYATVENDKGESKEVSQDIDCFDRTAPTVTATQDGKTINIRAADNKSGVTSILVNNKEYRNGDFEDGKLAYRIPEGTTMVIIKAEDAAGNLSRAVELPIESTVAALPVIIAPTPVPTPKAELLPEEAAIPEPKPTPTPRPEPETPEPEPPMVEAAAPPEPLPPAARAAVAAGGVGSTAMGGIWYWLRKVRLSKPVEELELMGKKLLYDESEFGGTIDPLDKTSGKEEL